MLNRYTTFAISWLFVICQPKILFFFGFSDKVVRHGTNSSPHFRSTVKQGRVWGIPPAYTKHTVADRRHNGWGGTASPWGHVGFSIVPVPLLYLCCERWRGLEPPTPTLAKSYSTTELPPHWTTDTSADGESLTNTGVPPPPPQCGASAISPRPHNLIDATNHFPLWRCVRATGRLPPPS